MAVDAVDVDVVGTDEASVTSESEKTTAQVMTVVPIELKEMLDKRADEDGKSTSGWLRQLIAEEFDYELPATIITRPKKYNTDEERKAAQAEKAKTRNELIKKLLEAHRAGLIDLGDVEDDE